MEPRINIITSTIGEHVESIHAQHASSQSPPAHEKYCELSEEGRTALTLRYALALPPGKERLPKGVGLRVAEEFGMAEGCPRKNVGTREGTAGQRAYRFSQISTMIRPAVGLHADEAVGDLGS